MKIVHTYVFFLPFQHPACKRAIDIIYEFYDKGQTGPTPEEYEGVTKKN